MTEAEFESYLGKRVRVSRPNCQGTGTVTAALLRGYGSGDNAVIAVLFDEPPTPNYPPGVPPWVTFEMSPDLADLQYFEVIA